MATRSLFKSLFKYNKNSNSRSKTKLVTNSVEQNIGKKLVEQDYRDYYVDYQDNIIPALSLIKTCIIENESFYDFLLSITNNKVGKLLTKIQSLNLEHGSQNEEDQYKLVLSKKQFIQDYLEIKDIIANITTLIEFMYSILNMPPVNVNTSKYDDVFVLNINVTIIDVIIPILLNNKNILLRTLQEKYKSKNIREKKLLNFYFDKIKIYTEFSALRSRKNVEIEMKHDLAAGKRRTKFRRLKGLLNTNKRSYKLKHRYNIHVIK